jgi:hypothetical protein
MEIVLVAGWFYLLIGVGAAAVAYEDTESPTVALAVVVIWPLLIGAALARSTAGR